MRVSGVFFWSGLVALLLGALAAVAATHRASGAEPLEMPTGPGGTIVGFPAAAPSPIHVTAYLRRPAGNGPFPAIIALHGCGGLQAPLARYIDWSNRLVGAGYAVLFPDSFGSRGFKSQCAASTPPGQRVSAARRSLDALGAAHWLQSQPFIAPQRIGVLGWSHGGITVLALVDRPEAALSIEAAVAFYPDCRDALKDKAWRHRVPLMIQIGLSDDWTPASTCQALAKADPGIDLHTYPDTYHDFDVPNEKITLLHGMSGSVNGTGTVHVGTNPVARDAAIAGTMQYFASHLLPAQTSQASTGRRR